MDAHDVESIHGMFGKRARETERSLLVVDKSF
jgi:hypothetical protein